MSKKILATQRSRMYRLFKESLKCCSCGYDRDTSVLEFHHIVPNNKLEEIPRLISIGEYDTIISEFKKCAVICSNCHNIIHNSTNAKVAMEVASSLKVVDTTYFENLCCTFNVLVNEEIESTMEDNTSSDNIEVLIVEDKLNKKKKMEILVNHLINNYDGVATDKLKPTQIARELSIDRMAITRYIDQLKTEHKLNGHVNAQLLR